MNAESAAPPLKERARELDLDAIRARCDAATPPPWVSKDDGWEREAWEVYEREGERNLLACDMDEPDATFIAHARTDIPLLLDALASANARVAELEAAKWDIEKAAESWYDGDINAPQLVASIGKAFDAQPPTEEPGK